MQSGDLLAEVVDLDPELLRRLAQEREVLQGRGQWLLASTAPGARGAHPKAGTPSLAVSTE